MHEYSVELLIVGDDVIEGIVSAKLGLKPTVFLMKGEPLGPTKVRKRSVWSFSVGPSAGNLAWRSLDDGLRCLAEKLLPLRDALAELSRRYEISAYCGHFGSGFGGGPSISAGTLRMLAELGLTLTIKTYWGEEPSDQTSERATSEA